MKAAIGIACAVWLGFAGSTAAGQVWSDGFDAVWHLSETGLAVRADSTANRYDSFPQNYEGDEGDFNGIAGITDVDELHALHDAAIVDVQAGNDAFGQAHYRFISVYCICVRSV